MSAHRAFARTTGQHERPHDPRVGTVLANRYHIQSRLGEGGMAVVYRARDLDGREVAVKLMSTAISRGGAAMRERFRREARTAASLAHPNIVRIFDHGESDDGTSFMVMELLEGSPLDEIIAAGPLDVPTALQIGTEVARGLGRAHTEGVLHRDLKPANVFVTYDSTGSPRVKLLDFGVARAAQDPRLTNAGELVGTPYYMAPERLLSPDSGAPADLYALGVMLFEMLTGQVPFHADELPALLALHMHGEVPRPSSMVSAIPEPLEALILRLLAKRPEERPADARTVEIELSRIAMSELGQLRTMQIATPSLHPLAHPLARQLPRREEAPTELRQWSSAIRRVQPPRRSWGRTAGAACAALVAVLAGAWAGQAVWASSSASSAWTVTELSPPAAATRTTVAAQAVESASTPIPVVAPRLESATLAEDAPARQRESAAVRSAASRSRDASSRRARVTTATTREGEPVEAEESGPSATGYLTLVTSPWTHVTLGGRSLGDTPLLRVALPAGHHTLRLTNPEAGIDEPYGVEVLADQTVTRRLGLHEDE